LKEIRWVHFEGNAITSLLRESTWSLIFFYGLFLIVAANGGSDLIYLNEPDPVLARDLVSFLSSRDYVSGIFNDPAFGQIKGSLPLSDVNLKGSAVLPIPAIIVNFRSFSRDADPVQSAVTVCDTGL
jgi:hypothetical protein